MRRSDSYLPSPGPGGDGSLGDRRNVPALPIRNVGVVLASPAEVEGGLLGWASADYGDLHIDGLAIRLTEQGKIVVTFPAKSMHRGKRKYIVWPLDSRVRDGFRAAILKAFSVERAKRSGSQS